MSAAERNVEKSPARRIENWPPYYLTGEVPELRVGNPDASVGVVTLWTPVDGIWNDLDFQKVAVIGQLKTPGAGLEGIIRTCASNRAIRYLVVCGKEMKEGIGGQALINLLEHGINEKGKVIDGPKGARISRTIPADQVETFREQVKLVDMRDVVNGNQIRTVISQLPALGPFRKEAVLLPLPEVETEKFPRKVGAEVIIKPTIGEAYVQVLKAILRFGPSTMTNYGQEAEDVLNLITVTNERIEKERSWLILPFTQRQVDDYIQKNFLSPEVPEGEWYTYGQRIFAFGPERINQFETVVAKLEKDRNDRGAIIVLYDPLVDTKALRNPCLYSIQASIEGDSLCLTGVFRSNDMAGAWPWNAFGLRRIQEMILERLQQERYPHLEMGPLITVSTRAHIYQSEREKAVQIVAEHQEKIREELDPRGNISIRIEEGEIIASLLSPRGTGEILQEFRGKTAHKVARLINLDSAISQVSHGLEIGIHLGWAEWALKKGLPYLQNKDYLYKLSS